MFGYDQGVLSSLLTLDTFAETFPQAGGSFSTLQSFMVAICEFGLHIRCTHADGQTKSDVWLERYSTSTLVTNWVERKLSHGKSFLRWSR
jgi:hypothetical protein